MSRLYSKILNLYENFFFNNIEKKFIKKFKKKKYLNRHKKIIIHIVDDYWSLVNTFYTLKNPIFKNYELIGLWTEIVVRRKGFFNFFIFLINLLISYLKKRKWSKLYKVLGVNKVYDLNNNFISNIYYNKKNFVNLNLHKFEKKNLLDFRIKDISLGNEIYDFILRYYQKNEVTINDNYEIKKAITYAFSANKNLNKIFYNYRNQISLYYPQKGLCYIQYGFPIKFFLSKKIKTIGTSSFTYYNKLFTRNNFYLEAPKNKFVKKEKILLAKKYLQELFDGKRNTANYYMRASSYKNDNKKIKNNILGIIFLPSFDDSPHIYGDLIFNDYFEWTVRTLDYFKSINFNISIKPHPNETYGSSVQTDYLKRKYNTFNWINKKSSNSEIFKKKILFGISLNGTVLHELAYHNIIPIAGSYNNPYKHFNFVFTPKSRKNYFNLIDRAINKKLKLPKNCKSKIYKHFYLRYLENHDYLKTYSRQKNLFIYKSKINENDIGILKKLTDNSL